ncbi:MULTISPECIES: ABC transporter permease [Natrialbaceae]|uniref:ABC transporter permease n=1 Tax=Natrialbaceae TaxID=1644061 RepID=UPI00207D0EDD|nr:ABC transporter permease [Natronococcus sp. CG52]
MSSKTVSSVTFDRVQDNLREVVTFFRNHPRLKKFVLIGIPFGVLFVFFVAPLIVMVWLSFLDGMPPAPTTLENYMRFVSSDTYMTVLWRTTVITVQTTVVAVALGYALAYSIVRFSKRATLLLLLVILPFWTNYIIRMYAWINILQSNGLLDTVLLTTGLINEPIGLLYSHEAVIIGFVYVYLPLATLPFYASLSGMNTDLIDAAKDLGAGPIKTFVTVTLPMTKSGIMVGVILVAIPVFGAFITPTLLGGTGNVMIGMVIEQQFTQAFNWPFGAAISVIVTILVIAALVVSVASGGNVLDRGENA